jgi:hypothetical protein
VKAGIDAAFVRSMAGTVSLSAMAQAAGSFSRAGVDVTAVTLSQNSGDETSSSGTAVIIAPEQKNKNYRNARH